MSVTVMCLVLSGHRRCSFYFSYLYLMSRKESVELWKSRNETDAIGRLLRISISRPSVAIPLILKGNFVVNELLQYR
jgi:hypothetical protein